MTSTPTTKVPISELPELEEGAVTAADELVIVDISAAATKKVKTTSMVADALKQLPASSVPGVIIDPVDNTDSIGSQQLQDGSVTARKLADVSSGRYLTSLDGTGSDGEFVGQVGSFNSAAYMWNGIRWTPMSLAISVTGTANAFLETTISNNGTEAAIEAEFVTNRTYAGKYLGYDATGNITAQGMDASNLPPASTNTFGVVRIPSGNGIAVSQGDIFIDNNVTAQALGGLRSIAYNSQGFVTSSRPYTEGDLPYGSVDVAGVIKLGKGLRANGQGSVEVDVGDIDIEASIATPVSPGMVMPVLGRGLAIAADGSLTVQPNPIDQTGGGAGTKISYDANGLVTGGTFLDPGDIPQLDFDQITSGTLDGAFIGDSTIPRRALADFAVSYVQEGEPPLDQGFSIGTFWYKESTKILRVFTGTRWAQVGASGGGGGSTATLEWAGFIDASTGLMTQTTSIGQNQGGFVVGQGLPAASDELTGYYAIVTIPGNGIPETPDDTYTENDWVICLGEEEGWQLYGQSAGGGGGAANLNDLLDVTIDLLGQGHVLTYDEAGGYWRNSKYLSGQLYGTIIQNKYSEEVSTDPLLGDLQMGELYFNVHADSSRMYLKTKDVDGNEVLRQWSSDDQALYLTGVDFQEPMYDAGDDDKIPLVAIREATTSIAGAMSAADKVKLDAISLDGVDGVQTLTGVSPVVVTDKDDPALGQNLSIEVNLVSNITNGLMLATDKIILDGLAAATQVQSDFLVTDTASSAYIKNKPDIATIQAAGYMSANDKAKLDNIASNATVGIPEAPNDGQQWARRNLGWSVVTATQAGAACTVSATPPGGPKSGDLWADARTGELHFWYDDGDSQQWVNTSTAGGGIYTEGIAKPPQMGGNPPLDPRPGDFWLDARTGVLFIYYADGDSQQWIACSSGDGGDSSGSSNIPVQSEPPQNPGIGDTYIDPDTLALYVYFNDGGSNQWAQISTTTASGGPAFTEDPPGTPSTGQTWIRPSTLKQYIYTGSAWASVICC